MEKRQTFVQGLITILIKQNIISEPEGIALEKGFKESGQAMFDDFLLEEGLIDKDTLLQALAVYYEVPSFDVDGYFFDHQLVTQFPKDVLLRNVFIPFEVDENILIVVASEPTSPDLLPIIGSLVSYDIQFYVGLNRDICDAIKEFFDRSLTDINPDEDIHEEKRQQKEVEYMENEEELPNEQTDDEF